MVIMRDLTTNDQAPPMIRKLLRRVFRRAAPANALPNPP